jgi:hypothetical protein
MHGDHWSMFKGIAAKYNGLNSGKVYEYRYMHETESPRVS